MWSPSDVLSHRKQSDEQAQESQAIWIHGIVEETGRNVMAVKAISVYDPQKSRWHCLVLPRTHWKTLENLGERHLLILNELDDRKFKNRFPSQTKSEGDDLVARA